MSSAVGTPKDGQLVIFLLAGQRYGVALERVERVVRMVALAPFPKAPPIVSGVVNFQGRLVPVVNVRRRFRLPERAPTPADQMMILRTDRRWIGFVVDAVESVLAAKASEVVESETLVPGLEYVRGIVRLPDGLIFVHDIDAFLSLEEDAQLADALGGRPA